MTGAGAAGAKWQSIQFYPAASYFGRWFVMSTSDFASTMKQPFDTGGPFSCRLSPNILAQQRG
jgi:hypothetical protein